MLSGFLGWPHMFGFHVSYGSVSAPRVELLLSHPSSSGMTGSGKLLVSGITGARGITANDTNDHREKDIGADKTPRDPEE